jgi:hypothetical protein
MMSLTVVVLDIVVDEREGMHELNGSTSRNGRPPGASRRLARQKAKRGSQPLSCGVAGSPLLILPAEMILGHGI